MSLSTNLSLLPAPPLLLNLAPRPAMQQCDDAIMRYNKDTAATLIRPGGSSNSRSAYTTQQALRWLYVAAHPVVLLLLRRRDLQTRHEAGAVASGGHQRACTAWIDVLHSGQSHVWLLRVAALRDAGLGLSQMHGTVVGVKQHARARLLHRHHGRGRGRGRAAEAAALREQPVDRRCRPHVRRAVPVLGVQGGHLDRTRSAACGRRSCCLWIWIWSVSA